MDDVDWPTYYVVRKGEYHDMKAEIDRLRAEIKLLRQARSDLRSLLDEFVDLCTEEQHSVEMLCLHRAAMKPDVWERAQGDTRE